MSASGYVAERTALLFVDPYNDFLSDGGKLWPKVEEVAKTVYLHGHLRAVVAAVRRAGIQVIIVPHHRWEPGDYVAWDHATPYQLSSGRAEVFAKGTWGAEWHPDYAPGPGDLVAKEHWGASGFANTDLDFLLKQCKVTHIIVIGLLANTCIEGTSRFASELGYHVTLVRDATAAFSVDRMYAAHELNAPTVAHEILTTEELLKGLAAMQPETVS